MVRDLWALRLQTLQSRANWEVDNDNYSQTMFSSQSEGETTDEESRTRKSNRSNKDTTPRVIDGLSICYIGTLLLRLPVTVGDFHRWATSGQLAYYRAITLVPLTMRERLPANFHILLDPQSVLQPGVLHTAILENMSRYSHEFGMAVPPSNHVLILYRWIRHLALPLEVYAATLRLASLLGTEFTYKIGTEPAARYHRHILRLAEAQLMIHLVIATKLLFPLDNITRLPRKPTDLAALAMDWSAWSAAHKSSKAHTSTPLSYQEALQTTPSDVLAMTNEKLDAYMDWYGNAFVEDEPRDTGKRGRTAEFRRAVLRFFPSGPTQPTDPSNTDDPESTSRVETDNEQAAEQHRLRAVQSALKPLRVLPDEDAVDDNGGEIKRPGSHYVRYRRVEDLSGYVREFYEEAARTAAMPVAWLVKGVMYVERRMQDWETAERRGEKRNR